MEYDTISTLKDELKDELIKKLLLEAVYRNNGNLIVIFKDVKEKAKIFDNTMKLTLEDKHIFVERS